jgi:hypothetical protein
MAFRNLMSVTFLETDKREKVTEGVRREEVELTFKLDIFSLMVNLHPTLIRTNTIPLHMDRLFLLKMFLVVKDLKKN